MSRLSSGRHFYGIPVPRWPSISKVNSLFNSLRSSSGLVAGKLEYVELRQIGLQKLIGVKNDVFPGERIVTVTSIDTAKFGTSAREITDALLDILAKRHIGVEAAEVQVQANQEVLPVAKLAFLE